MSACVDEPLSYFRLERYSLGELPGSDTQQVAEHLARCPVCRACYERLQADDRTAQLTELRLPAARRASRARLLRQRWAAAALVASLACTLFLIRNPKQLQVTSPDLEPPSSSKGSALTLEVVRVDAAGKQLEPTRFAAGDRFKLLVSCPEDHERALRVLAFQAADVFEPVPPQELSSCGNRRALQGAWQLDGDDAVDLCVVFGRSLRLENVRSAADLPEPHVCARLEP